MRKGWLGALLGLSLMSPSVQAASGWISDVLYVPIRAGAGGEYRIVHRGLKSGTRLEILEQSDGAEWTKVRYGDIEGYVASQYVSAQPTAAITLARVQEKLQATEATLAQTREQLKAVTAERNQLSSESRDLAGRLSEKEASLSHLEEVAAEPIRLDQANRELNQELSQLRTKLDAMSAENSMLRSDNTTSQWLVGVLILVAGAIVGFLAKGRGGRNRGSWV